MIDEGLTALSVEMVTNSSEANLQEASATFLVPRMLFLMASQALRSIIGTCLWAAAWMTTSGLCRRQIAMTRLRSYMSQITGTRGMSPWLASSSFSMSNSGVSACSTRISSAGP